MISRYHGRCWPAIAGGAVAALGATMLLVRDGWQTGFSVDHALMPALVGLTVLAGHLLWQAIASGRLVAAIGMLVLTMFGSTLTVYETMGRRAELRDNKVLSAAARQTARATAVAELASIERTYNWALPDMTAECAGAPDTLPPGGWPKCRSKRGTVRALEQRILTLKGEIRDIAPAPVDAKAERIAAIAAAIGVSGVDVKAIVAIVEPFAFPLFLEMGSILLFSFGLGRGSPNAPAPSVAPSVVTNDDEPVRSRSKEDALDDLKTLLKVGQVVPSQDWLANRWHVSKGTVSKWLTEWESAETVPARQRDGKTKYLVAA